MKKYALISSILAISMISNCMEQQIVTPQYVSIKAFPSRPLTTEAQKRISLEPEITFSLSDRKIEKLLIILNKRNTVNTRKTTLSQNFDLAIAKYNSAFPEYKSLEIEYNNLDDKLNLHLTSEDKQRLNDLQRNFEQLASKMSALDPQIIDLQNQCKQNQITKNECNSQIARIKAPFCEPTIQNIIQFINEFAYRYRKTEAILEFVKNELRKNETNDELKKSETDKLFITIQSKCQSYIDELSSPLNEFTKKLEQLSQTKEPSNQI